MWTTRRARALPLVLALALGLGACGSDDTETPTTPDPEPPAEPTPTSMAVSPTELALEALEATGQLQATVLDESGNAISGASVSWSTADGAVASVSSTGLVTAEAVGATTVTATSGALSADASVTVTQVAAAVSVTPESAELLPAASATYQATVVDANANAIPDAEVAWASGDESVATVDEAGVVTAVAEGTTTVTASAGEAEGTAMVVVLAPPPDLDFTADGELGGTVNAGSVTIPTGVTVTVTEDLVLSTTGPVSIEGTLTGDCVGVDLSAGGDLTLTGATVSTACGGSPPDEPTLLRLASAGLIELTDAVLTAGGEVLITTDPSVRELPDPDAEPTLAVRGPLAQGGAGPCILDNTVVQAGSGRDGGLTGGQTRGSGLFIQCRGMAVEDASFRGGKGGDGREADSRGESPAFGDLGERGGGVTLESVGDPLVLSGTVRLSAGDGGNGGDAFHFPTEPGSDAQAVGGRGARPGAVRLSGRESGITVGGELFLDLGKSGDGGDAVAVGADGVPVQKGGNASASGGGSFGFPLLPGGLYGGDHPVFSGEVDPASRARVHVVAATGNGGNARGTGGRGGDGPTAGAPGAPGGSVLADGGWGGRFDLEMDGVNPPSVTLGDGGDATFEGGRGGDGQPHVCSPGGDGGMGGSASGSGGGLGGRATHDPLNVSGAAGATTIQAFGNGGDGADGTGGGARGEPGADGVVPEAENPMAPIVTGSFQPGTDGDDVDCVANMDTDVQVSSDANGHDPFIQVSQINQMVVRALISALAMTIDPAGVLPQLTGQLTAASPAPGRAAQAATSFTFSLSGTGTIVGISGVVVTFEGTLEVDADGVPVSMSGELTVDANNDKLPPNGQGQRNPAVYTVEGSTN